MSRHAQRAQQDRLMEQRAREQQDREFNTSRVLDQYRRVYTELHGVKPQITYVKGWYHISRGQTYDAYRASTIIKMTEVLMARLHQIQTDAQIEHPELITEDN